MPAVQFRRALPLNSEVNGIAIKLVDESVGIQLDGYDVSLSLKDQKVAVAVTTTDIDQSVIDAISATGFDGDKLTEEQWQTISAVRIVLATGLQRLVEAMKFYLDNPRISESELSGLPRFEWSLDGNEWQQCPIRATCGSATMTLTPGYEGDWKARLTAALARDHSPVLIHAFRHLHRAKNEKHPSHRWIDATIAAELGIKEFLIAKEPKVAVLLLEMPSPPMSKLYGRILEHYAGVSSPHRKALENGAAMRNNLVHRPEAQSIKDSDAEDYVNEVELALLHLTTLLFPTDDLHQYTYEHKLVRKESILKEREKDKAKPKKKETK